MLEQYFINYLISFGQNLGSETLSLIFLIILYCLIIILWSTFAKEGLFLYNILAIILANIQVLKITTFGALNEPVALGTFLFATTFVVNDILTEHYDVNVAKLAIRLTIVAQLIMTLLMIFTLSYPSRGNIFGLSDENNILVDPVQGAMYTLFAPSLRILFASLCAYYIAQLIDITLYKKLKDYSNKKFLWLRLNVSNLISGLIDNIIFSSLAWVVLSPNPISFKSLIFTYILGTYIAKIIVSITATPLIYLSYTFAPHKL